MLATAFITGNECSASWSLFAATVHNAVRARRNLPVVEVMFVLVCIAEKSRAFLA
jgi:hypothetical protein